ncbi:argininosuccinate lyase [Arthrobacter sp. SW1]|uniref:argininosuccinate lyase n=1 Tax=Arthrobacter sp. SW1 TaxID=1920889 RepID=UPI000877B7F8|nr:argininosuccinate lyase [Arthrobacter sp. SW1]OFI38453.1 argininosuccinate lyase [Arthrobacter sp. SW1]
MTDNTKLWGGRFAGSSSPELARFSRSDPRYFAMAPYDLHGSRAHVRELNRAGLISDSELSLFISSIDDVARDVAAGTARPQEADEDVHTFLERLLIERMGPTGGKIRAGRSRNDQAANDLRLYMRDKVRGVSALIVELAEALAGQAEKHLHTPVPGFTHLQSAQPVVFGHQLLAHAQPLLRDLHRFQDWDRRAAVSPLGAAALAGSTFALTPETAALEQGYESSAENSIDAVGSRDAAIEFLFVCSLTLIDISRLCEEIISWASQQFRWIRMDDAYCTGSSIMPQKKNPDIAELARGKAGRVLGDLMGLMAAVKSLPLAYNRDLAEDKNAVLDAVETLEVALPALSGLVRTFEVNVEEVTRQATAGFTLATEVADWLARQDIPFSEAHHISGALVRFCEENGLDYGDLSDEQLASVDPRLTPGVKAVLTVEAALEAHSGFGGTAPARVAEQLTRLRARLDQVSGWTNDYQGLRVLPSHSDHDQDTHE